VGREDFGGREELNMCHHMANSTWLQWERARDEGSG
jgi:hypothetical protein